MRAGLPATMKLVCPHRASNATDVDIQHTITATGEEINVIITAAASASASAASAAAAAAAAAAAGRRIRERKKQHQTTENDTKIIKTMKVVENELIWIGLG